MRIDEQSLQDAPIKRGEVMKIYRCIEKLYPANFDAFKLYAKLEHEQNETKSLSHHFYIEYNDVNQILEFQFRKTTKPANNHFFEYLQKQLYIDMNVIKENNQYSNADFANMLSAIESWIHQIIQNEEDNIKWNTATGKIDKITSNGKILISENYFSPSEKTVLNNKIDELNNYVKSIVDAEDKFKIEIFEMLKDIRNKSETKTKETFQGDIFSKTVSKLRKHTTSAVYSEVVKYVGKELYSIFTTEDASMMITGIKDIFQLQ